MLISRFRLDHYKYVSSGSPAIVIFSNLAFISNIKRLSIVPPKLKIWTIMTLAFWIVYKSKLFYI